MINEIVPNIPNLQQLLQRLDHAAQHQMRGLRDDLVYGRIPEGEAEPRLRRLLSSVNLDPPLPLRAHWEAHLHGYQKAEDIGIYGSATEARQAAATHFAASSIDGADFDQVMERLWLRLDLTADPMFAAILPDEPAPAAAHGR